PLGVAADNTSPQDHQRAAGRRKDRAEAGLWSSGSSGFRRKRRSDAGSFPNNPAASTTETRRERQSPTATRHTKTNADKAGCPRSTVWEAIKTLEAAGIRVGLKARRQSS